MLIWCCQAIPCERALRCQYHFAWSPKWSGNLQRKQDLSERIRNQGPCVQRRHSRMAQKPKLPRWSERLQKVSASRRLLGKFTHQRMDEGSHLHRSCFWDWSPTQWSESRCFSLQVSVRGRDVHFPSQPRNLILLRQWVSQTGCGSKCSCINIRHCMSQSWYL